MPWRGEGGCGGGGWWGRGSSIESVVLELPQCLPGPGRGAAPGLGGVLGRGRGGPQL